MCGYRSEHNYKTHDTIANDSQLWNEFECVKIVWTEIKREFVKQTNNFSYTSAEHKRDKLQWQTTVISSYFFCLSASSGTEGIKHVKNFVPFLALYRGFLCTPIVNKQHFWCSVLFLLRINSNKGCGTL